jgi:hypothetical protein
VLRNKSTEAQAAVMVTTVAPQGLEGERHLPRVTRLEGEAFLSMVVTDAFSPLWSFP